MTKERFIFEGVSCVSGVSSMLLTAVSTSTCMPTEDILPVRVTGTRLNSGQFSSFLISVDKNAVCRIWYLVPVPRTAVQE